MKYTAFMLLAACGRVGFEAVPGDASVDSGATEITVHAYTVWNDSAPITPGGVPVSGATVLANAAVLHTDATGTAVIPATTPTTVHVIFQNPDMFEYVTTALDVPPGADVRIGTLGRSASPPTMTIDAPVGSTADYELLMPLDCGDAEQDFPAPPITFTYSDHCEGQAVRLVLRNGASHIDLGEVTLANGGTLDASTRTYDNDVATAVTFTDLPVPAATHAAALGYRTDSAGLIVMETPADGDITTSTNTFSFVEPPGDTVVVDVTNAAGEERTAIELVAPTLAFQAPPAIHAAATADGVTVPDTAFGAANAMRLLAVYQTPVVLEWTIIGPPRTGDLAFPALPPELAGIRPTDLPMVESILAELPDLDASGVMHELGLDLNGVEEQRLLAPGRRFSLSGALTE